jgi:hypothetical protein
VKDPLDHWKAMAARVGIARDGREMQRNRIVRDLDWSDWTVVEREVYAAAFLFPAPMEPLIDGITIHGTVMNLKRFSRTAQIIDRNGDVWRVVEHGRPEKAG